MNEIKIISEELGLQPWQAENTIKLIDEGNTIPFIARYRKEATGSLDDAVLREFGTRLEYLRSLDARRGEIVKLIDEQDKLTDELKVKIDAAVTLAELEDIYRPYRPKRRTRASVAKEKGLEPLAAIVYAQAQQSGDPLDIAAEYVDAQKGVESAEAALAGACDIIAEMISDDADYRKYIRQKTFSDGLIKSTGTTEDDSVYSMYYDFSQTVKGVAPHRVLAMNRGEKEGFLKVSIEADSETITAYLRRKIIRPSVFDGVLADTVDDAYKRLIEPSIEREIRAELTEKAEKDAIGLFSKNLYHLLMQPPFKGLRVLGVDPGYRTGCKLAVVDDTGMVRDTGVIFCTLPHHDKEKSARIVKELIEKYDVNLVAIGNGTASKESEIFISEVLRGIGREVYYTMVSEAGASVYSASKLASEEFPDFTVEQRSAASIARRIQDPLSELVKIDPKAIGVGQYQHDMNQKELSAALAGVVENCVNSVGVDLNTASAALLSYVAGINGTVAKNIVAYRDENGKFSSRKQLLKVSKLGEKAFTQCAGFLKIGDAEQVFDSTSVHPESYGVAADLLAAVGYSADDVRRGSLGELKARMKKIDMKKFCADHGVGMPTVTDIADSLLKPDRDPRDEMPRPVLMKDIMNLEDLRPGMVLTGTVRNVIDFGAFVDIGVHQDGLVHISQISNSYVKHPTDVLSVGDVVKVKVLEVNKDKKRISLTMKDVQ